MSVVSPKSFPIHWWNQFPKALRLITKIRFLASVGAGGVIYLTPLVFNKENFSATQIGTGLAFAALIGTIARLASGLLLDKGINSYKILRLTAFIAIIADLTLFNAEKYESFLQGQLLIGIAAGLYWPSIELAVPISCKDFPSSRGFALGRSADALGISIGALIGSIAASTGEIRLIYIFDIFWMFSVLIFLNNQTLKDQRKNILRDKNENEAISHKNKLDMNWINSLIPIILISLLTTGILSLLQSALPIDLVKGGINRPPLSEGLSSVLIAVKLILLVLLQWPIGKYISDKNIKYGLKLSLLGLGLGCLCLGLSSLWEQGAILIIIGQLPIALGLAAFLPTATEAIISETPIERQGLSMALFSQCFAISAFAAPLIAGIVLDSQGNGLYLWLIVSSLCLISFISINKLSTLKIKSG